MMDQFSRTELILGKEAMEKLYKSRVAVFGVGGVGGYVVEALARSGIGALDLIDSDRICISNLNRQIIATHKSIGMYKVEVASERVLEINPKASVNTYKIFYSPENADCVDLSVYDYVVDAIDTVSAKIELVCRCKGLGVPIISSMGAGNKVEASALEVADIFDTSVCPLAKVMRKELRVRGIESLKVVYSKELPKKASEKIQEAVSDVKNSSNNASSGDNSERENLRRQVPGSTSFVPGTAGLIIAGEVVKDLTGIY
jgi:tRNA A37 threonylcarbamoyladenosine dehydratase